MKPKFEETLHMFHAQILCLCRVKILMFEFINTSLISVRKQTGL